MSCHTMKHKGTPPVCIPRYAMLQSTSTWNSNSCADVSTPLTSRETQALFVVNSVKLHLTAFYYSKYHRNCIQLLFIKRIIFVIIVIMFFIIIIIITQT